jgi:hypothetical protein
MLIEKPARVKQKQIDMWAGAGSFQNPGSAPRELLPHGTDFAAYDRLIPSFSLSKPPKPWYKYMDV